MKIAVLGLRGFPGVQGGVEAHCEKLYPQLAKRGCEIKVFTRKPYVDLKIKKYKDVDLIPINCPRRKSFEAIVHSFVCMLAAKKVIPDVLHIHAIGPSLIIPLARALGIKVVMTNHGPDYKRKKWGLIGKLALRLGESWGSRCANEIICISKVIADDIKSKYDRNSHIIPNGVEIPEALESDEIIRKFSLTKGKYMLTVGRFVPEKGFCDLMHAFNIAKLKDWKLVIVGRADHESEYSWDLKNKAKENRNIVLTGFLSGKSLEELYGHAGLFVLPSYYEGLPIVLLEAMSYGLLCLASDIPANRCVDLPDENYFPAGDVKQLSKKLRIFIKKPFSEAQRSLQIDTLRQKYCWDDIAEKTMEVYKSVVQAS